MNIESFVVPEPDDIQTRDEVERLIQAFNNYFVAYMPDYSFAHSVLSDFNLSDDAILWALETDQIAIWREDRIKNWWMSQRECDIHEAAITQFLYYLFSIPEAIRIQLNDEEA
jgi:hypothetical protein